MKHKAEVRNTSFNASSVDVTFKPLRREQGATAAIRTFDVTEFIENRSAIFKRYGQAESVRHNLSDEDESRLAVILDEFKTKYMEETARADVNEGFNDSMSAEDYEKIYDFMGENDESEGMEI